ncbi:MAG: hypothetical protein KKD01_00490 [Proteobacteria bacterium]|nr:hypothetical protein [Pseudomonadota bacterium]MBU1232443.1 hypothetical protein [Pseudomonadota bacterium]MBU1420637.1 hypothetical protein [Pseudomonadota bacterium]MBU1453175.1 hypothetical protein [Pseudomonadota bacterium]
MKSRWLLAIICCFFFGTTAVNATDLRGRVDATGPYASAPFPLAKATVEIKRQDSGQSVVASYRTGRDGMYYFRNIQPGQYLLVVNNSLSVPIQVSAKALQDIGPLLFRY